MTNPGFHGPRLPRAREALWAAFQAAHNRRAAAALLLVVIALTLAAGLHPKDFRFRNEARWMTREPGLRFDQYGIAATAPFLDAAQASALRSSGASIEISFAPPPPPGPDPDRFRFLFVFHDGHDHRQLVLARWDEWLIFMQGDDYGNRRRTPRLSCPMPAPGSGRHLLTIVHTPGRTSLYLDGQPVDSRRDFPFLLPAGQPKGRLILGNSPYGAMGWAGLIGHFAVFSSPLPPEVIASRHAAFQGGSLPPPPESPFLFYPLRESSGTRASDHAGTGPDLVIPRYASFPPKRIFRYRFTVNRILASDILLNLFGFLPFGLAAALVLRPRTGFRHLLPALAVTILGFALSLGIESAQTWLPSRHSSPLDLALNTAGAALGALLATRLRIPPSSAPKEGSPSLPSPARKES